jgi:hypothetical protein
MKSGSPGKPSVELPFPAWVPAPVALLARQRLATANECITAEFGECTAFEWMSHPLLRKRRIDAANFGKKVRALQETTVLTFLVLHPRMRRVWHELSRRRRDGTFLHPAQSTINSRPAAWPVVGVNVDEPQGAAMAQLLEAVLRYIRPSPSPATMTRREAEQLRDRDLETALNLRTDALNTYYELPGYCDEGKPFDGSPWRCLSDAARFYEEKAAKNYAANLRAASDRNRGDATARGFARAVSAECRRLFSSPMYGLVAIIASVALGREIEPRTVRQWCARPCG